jgi:hypothetical protein
MDDKQKLSDAMRTVSDFVIELSDYEDHGEYKFNNQLKKTLFDILSCGKYEIVSFDQRKDKEGKFVSHSEKTTRMLGCIDWIKDNLDVWKVKELPETPVDYELRIYNRKFIFFRGDLPPPNFK